MNFTNLFLFGLTVQILLIALDLTHRYRLGRAATAQGERSAAVPLHLGIEVRPLLFLVGFMLLYGVIQMGGLSLVPGAEELLESLRRTFTRTSWVSPVPELSTPQAIGLAIVAFYIAGFWDYIWHRFFSHHRWFFFTHEYHHVPKQVFLGVPGIIGRPFAVVVTFPTIALTALTLYALLSLVGAPAFDLRPLTLLVVTWMVIGAWTHCQYLRRFPRFHRLLTRAAITTPQDHLLHHDMHLRCNYGNFTTLWDRIFGTYRDPADHPVQTLELGLPYDQDFLGAITAGKWKLSDRIRQRFQVGRYCNIKPLEKKLTDPS